MSKPVEEQTERPPSEKQEKCPVVYFDGACPLCQREIAYLQTKIPDDNIEWLDVSEGETPNVAPDLGKAEAMKRFHIRDAEGKLRSGAQAFVYLWSRHPRGKYAARVARLPGIMSLLEIGYRAFLIFRPLNQKLARLILPARTDVKSSTDK